MTHWYKERLIGIKVDFQKLHIENCEVFKICNLLKTCNFFRITTTYITDFVETSRWWKERIYSWCWSWSSLSLWKWLMVAGIVEIKRKRRIQIQIQLQIGENGRQNTNHQQQVEEVSIFNQCKSFLCTFLANVIRISKDLSKIAPNLSIDRLQCRELIRFCLIPSWWWCLGISRI